MHRFSGILLILIAVLFTGLGIYAASNPAKFMAEYDLIPKTGKGAAEVRCFFGGTYLSWAAMITLAGLRPGLRQGLLAAIAISLGCIAVLRIPSLMLEGLPAVNGPAMIAEGLIAALAAVLAMRPSRAV